MRRFVLALVPGAVFGAFVALGAQSLTPPPFEAFVGNVAQSLAALREADPGIPPGAVPPESAPPASVDEAPNPTPAGSVGDAAVATGVGSPAVAPMAPSVEARAIPDAATSEAERASSGSAVDAIGVDAPPTALPDAFAEDFAWWGRIEADASGAPATQASMPAAAEAVAGTPDAAPDRSFAAATDEAAAGAAADVGAAPAEVATAPVAPRASVWIPFHSERSAAGFARRLSRALERPFDVERRGAGRYQVVFAYRDAAERDEIFARVAQITGEGP